MPKQQPNLYEFLLRGIVSERFHVYSVLSLRVRYCSMYENPLRVGLYADVQADSSTNR